MNFWVKVSYSFFIFVINLISVLANNENADNAKMNFVHLRILFSWGKIFTGIFAKPVKRLQRKYKISLFFSLIDDFVIQKQEFWISLMLELKLSFSRATDISTSREAFPETGMLPFGFVLSYYLRPLCLSKVSIYCLLLFYRKKGKIWNSRLPCRAWEQKSNQGWWFHNLIHCIF